MRRYKTSVIASAHSSRRNLSLLVKWKIWRPSISPLWVKCPKQKPTNQSPHRVLQSLVVNNICIWDQQLQFSERNCPNVGRCWKCNEPIGRPNRFSMVSNCRSWSFSSSSPASWDTWCGAECPNEGKCTSSSPEAANRGWISGTFPQRVRSFTRQLANERHMNVSGWKLSHVVFLNLSLW